MVRSAIDQGQKRETGMPGGNGEIQLYTEWSGKPSLKGGQELKEIREKGLWVEGKSFQGVEC